MRKPMIGVLGNALHQMIGKESVSVNSYHHQGIKTLSAQLAAVAQAEDGLIEAVIMPERKFILAVQWHPEFSYQVDDFNFKLFVQFVKSCESEVCGDIRK
ncbi:gamma-glutamyl-gamma-aminobutyrate hydrolase family protein [Paenibacillus alba]|uniref:Gamma-glutamyl-gamma-aminobutyrate hydrolase family protein n=1 Tax=Paenibacillus alba TaxID=1197127 RepID=A0ABU6G8I6_9BACL|nr:gamma-glutamyl-gamma-aminobutyrate hydrolase family protein [Paenibacillus alba]MEC0229587.1 gamma-glutamyl-gamma-aminobutyrate hydrolase family protein [Paenibacillus alba]